MDLTIIGGALASVKTIIDISRTLEDQKVISAINSAVADIQVKLIDAQQQVLQTQEENSKLKAEVANLRDTASIANSIVSHDGAVWKKLTDGIEDGPFCSRCWGWEKKLIYPTYAWKDGTEVAHLDCHNHQTVHSIKLPAALVTRLGKPMR